MTLIKLYKRISNQFSKKETTSNIELPEISLPEINFNYRLDFNLYNMDKLINEIFTDLQKKDFKICSN